MNPTATPFNIFPLTEQVVDRRKKDGKSLLKRVFARLASYSNRDRCEVRSNRGSGSFIDEYLLDPRMGPEISRTLRR